MLLECQAWMSAPTTGTRGLHGDGQIGNTAVTAVMGMHWRRNTAVYAGMGTGSMVEPRRGFVICITS